MLGSVPDRHKHGSGRGLAARQPRPRRNGADSPSLPRDPHRVLTASFALARVPSLLAPSSLNLTLCARSPPPPAQRALRPSGTAFPRHGGTAVHPKSPDPDRRTPPSQFPLHVASRARPHPGAPGVGRHRLGSGPATPRPVTLAGRPAGGSQRPLRQPRPPRPGHHRRVTAAGSPQPSHRSRATAAGSLQPGHCSRAATAGHRSLATRAELPEPSCHSGLPQPGHRDHALEVSLPCRRCSSSADGAEMLLDHGLNRTPGVTGVGMDHP